MYLYESINKLINEFPTLFKDINREKSEIKVLDHLFITNGNGFDWYDGYLIEFDKKQFKSKWDCKKLANKISGAPKYGNERFLLKLDNKFFSTDTVENIGIEGYEIMIPQKSTTKFYPYPICKYSQILQIPNNIKIDWLAGASKILKITEEFYKNHPDDKFLLNTEMQMSKNLQEARKIVDKFLNKKGIYGKNEDEIILSVIPKNHRKSP